MPSSDDGPRTLSVGDSEAGRRPAVGSVRGFQIRVLEGPAAGKTWESSGERCAIGSHESNDIVIDDPTVSRFHCEVEIAERGATLRDQQSRNGTTLDGVSILEAFLRGGSLIRIGNSVIRFQYVAKQNRVPISARTRFGGLIGSSVAMRTRFAMLERAAASDVTVLLEGETGTGKEGAAFALHAQSERAEGPFIVVDCGAIPANLLESELFGHEQGAFTGADSRRSGAFEEADGGTIFLDELGELPGELQPKLLRVLESREIRPVGATEYKKVDLRVVAATNRDLRSEVNDGAFRPDLYFRLAVVRIDIPPLRERPEDIAPLCRHLLAELGADESVVAKLSTPSFLGRLRQNTWPGNVRELRNYLERCLVFEEAMPLASLPQTGRGPIIDTSLSYADARKRVLRDFERHYVEALIKAHGGNVSAAARAAAVDRAYLYRLMRRANKDS